MNVQGFMSQTENEFSVPLVTSHWAWWQITWDVYTHSLFSRRNGWTLDLFVHYCWNNLRVKRLFAATEWKKNPRMMSRCQRASRTPRLSHSPASWRNSSLNWCLDWRLPGLPQRGCLAPQAPEFVLPLLRDFPLAVGSLPPALLGSVSLRRRLRPPIWRHKELAFENDVSAAESISKRRVS